RCGAAICARGLLPCKRKASFWRNNSAPQLGLQRVLVARVQPRGCILDSRLNLRSLARILDSRRYAFRYRGHLARCRRKLAGGSRLRVLFLVNDNTKWNADSVYKLLRDDERFDCSI